jgi:beta-lactamase superfamily II metal-dependent hydrolase
MTLRVGRRTMSTIKFIGYPEASIFDKPTSGKKRIKKVLWGDWAAELGEESGSFKKITCRGVKGWINKKDLQENRILEVNFIDVGQGDGCFIVTPKDEFILIDAGESDNMYRFLRWRFNLSRNRKVIPIKHLIISHPDSDHYRGFSHIVKSPRFKIENICHNGIVERTGADTLGPVDKIDGEDYLTDVVDTMQKAKDLLSDDAVRGRKLYPNLLHRAIFNHGVNDLKMLGKGDQVPGYGEQDEVHFKVLGPVSRKDAATGNKKTLKYFHNNGETKNGHSVIIKLEYDDVKMLLGGDLNDASEEFLANHYTGFDPHHVNEDQRKEMIEKGRKVFQSDIAKSCHHGSHKFLDDFLSFIYPLVTVISSGDNETHTHPRPDSLGAIGKRSRGKRPLIFSTELARSAKDKVEIKDADLELLAELNHQLKDATTEEKKNIRAAMKSIKENIGRNIAVYGMINVRTDGKKVVIAQKKEQKGAGFILHKLELDANGELQFTK